MITGVDAVRAHERFVDVLGDSARLVLVEHRREAHHRGAFAALHDGPDYPIDGEFVRADAGKIAGWRGEVGPCKGCRIAGVAVALVAIEAVDRFAVGSSFRQRGARTAGQRQRGDSDEEDDVEGLAHHESRAF